MLFDAMADRITAKDLAEKKSDFVLIDVREADEVAEDGTIEGGINIPLGQLIRKARQGGLEDGLKEKTICTFTAMEVMEAISVLMNLTRKGLQV